MYMLTLWISNFKHACIVCNMYIQWYLCNLDTHFSCPLFGGVLISGVQISEVPLYYCTCIAPPILLSNMLCPWKDIGMKNSPMVALCGELLLINLLYREILWWTWIMHYAYDSQSHQSVIVVGLTCST